MKKILLFFFAILFSHSIFATHIIGGSITYEYLGNDNYKIRLEVLRDCFNGDPNAWFDDPASVGFFDENNTLVTDLQMQLMNNDTISINVPNSVCLFPAEVCIHKTVYNDTINLPPISGGYTVAYQRCCRPQTILNLINPLATGMTFQTHIDTDIENSSPQFNLDIPFAIFVNSPFVYDGSATDFDGDSLAYEFVAPFSGADQTIPQPDPPNPPPYDPVEILFPAYSVDNLLGGNYPLTIDASTGEMIGIPTTLGVFQIAYAVKEFRNGNLINTSYREFTFVVILPNSGVNFDVSGSVLVNGNTPLDVGKVETLERDVSTNLLSLHEEQTVAANGEYSFVDIPPGVFYIKATVDSSSIYYDDYLPTYYNSSAFWYDAIPVNQCDTTQLYRDIHLIHVDSLTGTGVLEGFVSYPNGSNTAVVGLDLLLANENGELLQARTTDSQGYFKFKNLPNGNYLVYADLINSEIYNDNPPLIAVDNNEMVQLYLYHDSISLELTITDIEEVDFLENTKIDIYPNPTDGQINLMLETKQDDVFTIKLYNMYGQLLGSIFENEKIPSGKFTKEISLDKYGKGVYFIEIENERGRALRKIIRQ